MAVRLGQGRSCELTGSLRCADPRRGRALTALSHPARGRLLRFLQTAAQAAVLAVQAEGEVMSPLQHDEDAPRRLTLPAGGSHLRPSWLIGHGQEGRAVSSRPLPVGHTVSEALPNRVALNHVCHWLYGRLNSAALV